MMYRIEVYSDLSGWHYYAVGLTMDECFRFIHWIGWDVPTLVIPE